MIIRKILVLVLMLLLGNNACFAAGQASDLLTDDAAEVGELYEFFGLASYYNDVGTYLINSDSVLRVEINESVAKDWTWLAQVGRFKVAFWNISDMTRPNSAELSVNDVLRNRTSSVVEKSELYTIAPELDQLRYAHLWAPLAHLAKLVEASLLKINSLSIIGNNWGVAIIFYCLLVKILLIPISLLTSQLQRRVSEVSRVLTPQLENIKKNFDGEEAHKRIMSAHRELGVGPFYSLKPLFSTLIQIPILVATFNALGEMPQINGESFLWISNLAYPDMVGKFGFSAPFLGDSVNLLPVLMALVSVVSTLIFTNDYANDRELKAQKRNLYLMAIAFLILFYPFPASMVLYWMASNFFHLIHQKIFK